jgi:alpha-2-macroglobulin
MSGCASRFITAVIAIVWLLATAVHAQDLRTVLTTPDADYFGFDLRTERDVTLDECKSICLADNQCRAFTYNERASWCFLKSDYSVINPFQGATAGRVVEMSAEADIGAPLALAFLPAEISDEARSYRQEVLQSQDRSDVGFVHSSAQGENAMAAGAAREAATSFRAALATAPEDSQTWAALSRALISIATDDYDEVATFGREASSAALIAYRESRTASTRAIALAALAAALERREYYRPAIEAYRTSLELRNDGEVRAAYADLRARQGFRVTENTVENDLISPRACVQFSEPLQRSGTNYADFVRVNEAPPAALDVSERQICVEGLQHGSEYRIQLRQGLPSAIGEVLEAPVALTVYVQDRPPSARFTGPNFVLPSHGRQGVPVVTVNADSATVTLYRIGDRSLARLVSGNQFLSQMGYYELMAANRDLMTEIWKGTIEVASELNREVITSFPVDEALPEREPGVYVMSVLPEGVAEDSWEPRATQWFVVSDLGLSTFTGEDGLSVFVRSLGSALPIAGVELQLLAVNNEILGQAISDADGRAVFAPGLSRADGSMAPALVTAAHGENDFVFLDLTSGGFDLTDRGVEGRAAPGALDIFAWTERGIYRAGEDVHVSALARDDAANAVTNLPLTLILTRPDGTEDRRVVMHGEALGGYHHVHKLQPTAMRGNWTAAIHADPAAAPISTTRFLVEDFVPDRIEFDLVADVSEFSPGQPVSLRVDGRYLYGAPASGLALEGEINLAATRDWVRFPGYRFGLADEDYEGQTVIGLDDLPRTDADGVATFEASVGSVPSTTQLTRADIVLRLRENGGRAVERRVSLEVTPQDDVIGIRPSFSGDQIGENSNAGFSLIAADPQGDRVALAGARWSLVKVERNYQWYRSGGSWNYEPIEVERRAADGVIDISANTPASLSLPVEWGRYRLDVESSDPTGPIASYTFDAGWFVEATTTETPDGLEISLDRDSYQSGDTALLRIDPRFAGEAMVVIGSERIIDTITVSVPEGGTSVEIPVTSQWGAGAYVTAVLYRPGEGPESRMPARAIGVQWISVDSAPREIGVSMSLPERAQPRGELVVPVSLEGIAEGEEAYVAVAAVDVGILNLTGYMPPDPQGWYYGQRQLGIELRDLYGRLIDGSLGAAGRIRTGGDGGGLSMQGSPPTEQLVAFFSGPVRVEADGTAEVRFDIPEFNGTVRVMAVAWSADKVGQASSDVIVRDALVITAGQPRFLATGDAATIRLDIANTDGPAGAYELAVSHAGTGAIEIGRAPASVDLDEGGSATLNLLLTASAVGDNTITVALSHADGLSVERTLHLPVRLPAMPVTNRQVIALAPGASLRVDEGLLGSSILDGASVSIGVSPIAAFDLPSMLMTLDRYPYGCAEQTISRALPLLYVSELSAASGMEDDASLRTRVQDALDRVLTFQTSAGTFGLWGPGYGDLWLDAYVTDFLTRARENGYEVPQLALDQAVRNLGNAMAYTTDVAARGTEMAYALYVLARNRKASIGDLRYYADTRIDEFTSPMARAHLGAALALYGDTPRAERVFMSALSWSQSGSQDALYRSDYGSPLRDAAGMLALAAETTPAPAIIPAMIERVSALKESASRTSTQEEAWMVLAARAVEAASDAIRLTINDAENEGSFARRIEGSALAAAPVTIRNDGGQPVDAVITTVAAPADPLPAGGDGFAIERSYYTLAGEPASMAEVAQNERFVVVLRVSQFNDWPARIAVTDLLPAGLEIDNPRLVSSAELSGFDWLGDTLVAHSEFRDDRFIAAFDREEGNAGDFTVAYVVRAVTPGIYVHPAAVVEDMYRPQFNARSAEGMMEVVAGQ